MARTITRPHLTVAASAQGVASEESHGAYRAVIDVPAALLGEWVDGLVADRLEKTPRPAGYVPSTHLWCTEGSVYVGRVQIRHRLTDFLPEQGGHIGYFVAAAHRGQGHATASCARPCRWPLNWDLSASC